MNVKKSLLSLMEENLNMPKTALLGILQEHNGEALESLLTLLQLPLIQQKLLGTSLSTNLFQILLQ
jgi:hypothetical protein